MDTPKLPLSNILIASLFGGGIVIVTLSLGAEFFDLDITPGFGIIQIAQLLIGITAVTTAGLWHIYRIRKPLAARSLQADIGVRLCLTGLVFTHVAGLSDVLQIGTHLQPQFTAPYVGPLQLSGMILGMVTICIGLIIYYNSRGRRQESSLAFLLNKTQK